MYRWVIFFLILLMTPTVIASEGGKATKERIRNRRPIETLSPKTPAGEVSPGSPATVVDEVPVGLGFDRASSLSPGMTIGTTIRDYQSRGRMNRQVDWRGTQTVHFAWTKQNFTGNLLTYYNAWDAAGGALIWVGGTNIHSALQKSAFTGLDVDDLGRAVVGSQWDSVPDGNYRTALWYDQIAGDNNFTGAKVSIADPSYIFPSIEYQVYSGDTVTHVFTQEFIGENASQQIRYYRRVGNPTAGTWDYPPVVIDTVRESYSQTVTASRVSGKVALVWAAGLPAVVGGGESVIRPVNEVNDIYYMISGDMGQSWGSKYNITQSDSSAIGWRAYQDLSCLITGDNHLHVVWDAREYSPIPPPSGTFPHYYGSSLFHWSDENPGYIKTIKSANWNIPQDGCVGDDWNEMSIVKPQISECDGKLYAVFVQFNDIHNGIYDDCHAGALTDNPFGTANGEIYVSISADHGWSWDAARNLTNSYTPRCDTAPLGLLECDADQWPSVARFGMYLGTGNFTGVPVITPLGGGTSDYYLDVFYVNDKFPGRANADGGAWTTNPMKWFRVPCVEPVGNAQIAFLPSEITEPAGTQPGTELDTAVQISNYGNQPLYISIVNITKLTGAEYDWLGVYGTPGSISAGGQADMHILINKGGAVYNSPYALEGVVEIVSNAPTSPDTIVVRAAVAEQSQTLEWASIRTAHIRVIMNNAGNLGNQGNSGAGGCNFDFFDDCDTTGNTSAGASDNAKIYLYDASPYVLGIKGSDTLMNSYYIKSSWLTEDGFIPSEPLTVDSGAPDYQYLSTGRFMAPAFGITMECRYWAPTSPESADFIIQEIRAFNHSGSPIANLYLGDIMDWDVPSDSGVDNAGVFNINPMVVCNYGGEYGADPIANNDCVLANQRHAGISYYGGYKLPYSGVSDTISIFQSTFTCKWNDYTLPNNDQDPGALYEHIAYTPGIEVNTEPWWDQKMISAFGKFSLADNAGVVLINILASEYNGGLAGIKTTINKARTWISSRPAIFARPDYYILRPLVIIAYSPVNLWVIDPRGDYIGRDSNNILGQTIFPAAYYNDVAPDDIDSIVIDFPLEGIYQIQVIRIAGTSTGQTYSVGTRINGTEQCLLVANASVPGNGTTPTYSYVVEDGWHYKNGDANDDQLLNIKDITFLINYLYRDGTTPYPELSGDADCNLLLNIKDITYLINYLYREGPEPCKIRE